jgi:hypothetical protein
MDAWVAPQADAVEDWLMLEVSQWTRTKIAAVRIE